MHIRDIKITNFKNIENLLLENLPQLVVLGGPNGVGKSTILDAITGFYYSRERRSIGYNPVTLGKETAEVEITFQLFEEELNFLSESGQTNVDPTQTESVQWGKNGNVSKAIQNPILRVFSQFDARNDFPDVGILDYNDPHRIFQKRNPTSIPTAGPNLNKARRRYGPGIQKYTLLKDFLFFLATQHGMELRRLLKSGTENVSLEDVPDPLDDFRKSFDSMLAPKKFLDVDLNVTPTLYQVETTLGTIDIDDLSSGEKEIAFVFGEFIRKKLVNSIILFDELDLHLNVEIQRRMIPALLRIGKNNQIWITTHSLSIMDSIPHTSLFRLSNPSGENQIKQVFSTADRLNLFSEIAGSAGLVTVSKNIVFLEGNIHTDSQIYSSFFENIKDEVSFVPSGSVKDLGVTSSKVLQLLESEPGYNFFYSIRDRDYLKDDIRDEIIRNGRNRIYVLEKYHIENYLLDWRLIHQCVGVIDPTTGLSDEEAIKGEFHRIAHENSDFYKANYLANNLNQSLRLGLKHFGLGGSDYHDQAKQQAKERFESVQELLSEAAIDDVISETDATIDSWLGSDEWANRLPARRMIKNFVSENCGGCNSQVFQNMIIEKMRSNPPDEIKEVIRKFIDSLPL